MKDGRVDLLWGEVAIAPGRIRTCGLRFRKPPLYPTELRARNFTNDSRSKPVGKSTMIRPGERSGVVLGPYNLPDRASPGRALTKRRC